MFVKVKVTLSYLDKETYFARAVLVQPLIVTNLPVGEVKSESTGIRFVPPEEVSITLPARPVNVPGFPVLI